MASYSSGSSVFQQRLDFHRQSSLKSAQFQEQGQSPELSLAKTSLTKSVPMLSRIQPHASGQLHQSNMLPNFFQFFSHSLKNPASPQDLKWTQSKQSPSPQFPVIELLMKDPIPLEKVTMSNKHFTLHDLQREEIHLNKRLLISNRWFSFGSLGTAIQYQKRDQSGIGVQTSQRQFQIVKYKICYRLSHKFTLRFKTLEIQVPADVSLQAFSDTLLSLVFGVYDGMKRLFIQKERDLVPLVDMKQLFKKRTNYVQIRDSFEECGVIAKPALLKKRNRPDIGLTKLSLREMGTLERKMA